MSINNKLTEMRQALVREIADRPIKRAEHLNSLADKIRGVLEVLDPGAVVVSESVSTYYRNASDTIPAHAYFHIRMNHWRGDYTPKNLFIQVVGDETFALRGPNNNTSSFWFGGERVLKFKTESEERGFWGILAEADDAYNEWILQDRLNQVRALCRGGYWPNDDPPAHPDMVADIQAGLREFGCTEDEIDELHRNWKARWLNFARQQEAEEARKEEVRQREIEEANANVVRTAERAVMLKWQECCKAIIEANRQLVMDWLSQYPQTFAVYKIVHRAERCHEGCDADCNSESYVLTPDPDSDGWYTAVSSCGTTRRKRICNRVSIEELLCKTSASRYCKRLEIQHAGAFYHAPMVEPHGLEKVLAGITHLPEVPRTYFLERHEVDSYIEWSVYGSAE